MTEKMEESGEARESRTRSMRSGPARRRDGTDSASQLLESAAQNSAFLGDPYLSGDPPLSRQDCLIDSEFWFAYERSVDIRWRFRFGGRGVGGQNARPIVSDDVAVPARPDEHHPFG